MGPALGRGTRDPTAELGLLGRCWAVSKRAVQQLCVEAQDCSPACGWPQRWKSLTHRAQAACFKAVKQTLEYIKKVSLSVAGSLNTQCLQTVYF